MWFHAFISAVVDLRMSQPLVEDDENIVQLCYIGHHSLKCGQGGLFAAGNNILPLVFGL